VLCQAGLNRVQVNIAGKMKQILIALNAFGLESSLEQSAHSLETFVDRFGV
jgi:hypothetical protein